MRASLSGTLATMGSGVPYAIAAKLNHPDKCVIALVGDGAMQMNGLAELLTIVHYRHEWKDGDPRLIVLVLHNNDLNLVTWEMRAMQGEPKFELSQRLPECNYAAFADMIGLKGIRVDDPEEVGAAWDAAFAADEPIVLDAICDPNVPPIPPHVTWEQTAALMSSLLKGDAAAGDIVRHIVKSKVTELVH
jgi:pyruvate dehydrogenase (quinone)